MVWWWDVRSTVAGHTARRAIGKSAGIGSGLPSHLRSLDMAAPRKAASERHINRYISLRPQVAAYLDSLPVGQKSPTINDLIEASPAYQTWLKKCEGSAYR